MKRLFLAPIICAIVCSVWADGVPLITPGPALPANNPMEQFWKKGNPKFVKLHPIVLNDAAFGADVVTAGLGVTVAPPPVLNWRVMGTHRLTVNDL